MGAVEQAGDVVRLGGVAAEQAVLPEQPERAGLGAGLLRGALRQGRLEVDRLRLVALAARLQALEQPVDRALSEARHGQVEIGVTLEPGEQLRQQGLIPVPADLIQREIQQVCLLRRELHEDDGHFRDPEAPGGAQALMARDDPAVGLAGDHRIDEPEPLQGALQRLQAVVVHGARIGRVRDEVVDRHGRDGEGRRHASGPFSRSGSG